MEFTPHKYGEFSDGQIQFTKKDIQKKIFFLLLCVDPDTKDNYAWVDIERAFSGLLHRLGGLNEILFYPNPLVEVISLLEEARLIRTRDNFSYGEYRKCILDAGRIVLQIDALPDGDDTGEDTSDKGVV